MSRADRLGAARLYLCLGDRPDLGGFVTAVCEAGVDIVQLREQHLDDGPLLDRAVLAARAAQAAGALFVMNDRPDLAMLCGADGVHVGQDDLPPERVRQLMGPEAIVGLSTHRPSELEAAGAEPVDYVSVGPVAPTPTKPGRPGTGLGYVRLAARSLPEPGSRPFFVTGGVAPDTLAGIAAAGARRFVVVRAITDAPDPVAAVGRLRRLIDAF
ncbi:MAG: thiamine phosphate synthase [Acidimicrobiia bacterium]